MKVEGDATGTILGLLTIPMALLSAGSVVAGLALVVMGSWLPVVVGVAVFLPCAALAWLLERLVIMVDDAAAVSLGRRRRRAARLAAALSGVLPVVVILVSEVQSLRTVLDTAPAPAVLVWLWGYGVATGPWTLFAHRVSRFRRTLVSIRAYAGHVALWLFSLGTLALDAPAAAVVAAMLVPAIIPCAVGMLLALADRDAIANVRV